MSTEPARKKQKRSESLDADAKLAAELQAQENQLARARSTRGGGGGRVVKKKKAAATRKKSAKRVRGSDESEVSGGEAPAKRKGGGFQKPFNLSPHLADLVGETQVCSLPSPFSIFSFLEVPRALLCQGAGLCCGLPSFFLRSDDG